MCCLGTVVDVAQFPVRLVLNSTSSKEIEWHCKHYVGRGLMKRFNNGNELAKEIGVSPEVLKKTCECACHQSKRQHADGRNCSR